MNHGVTVVVSSTQLLLATVWLAISLVVLVLPLPRRPAGVAGPLPICWFTSLPSLHPCWTRGFHQVLGLRLKPSLPVSGIPAPLDIRLHPQAEPLLCPPSQLLWQITSQRQDAHPALFWKLSGLLCHELTSTLQRLFTRHHPPGLTPFLGQTRPRVPFPDPTLP